MGPTGRLLYDYIRYVIILRNHKNGNDLGVFDRRFLSNYFIFNGL